ncbi:MAG TPA: ROK family protein [Candidatus Limnocylindrales bacterium]
MTADTRDEPRSLVAGVDVGGTKVAVLIVDAEDRLLGRAIRPMGGGGTAGVEQVVGAIRAALADASADASALAAIGIGVPGRIDPNAGVVGLATNLDWEDLPLATLIEDRLGVPCSVENDVGLAASGLAVHPIADGARSLAYVAVGTGIGAGLVLDGELRRGDRGMAGEIGHVIVDPEGAACRCGQRGCLETVASGPHIARRAVEAGLTGADPITARTVFEAAAAGDPTARAVADETGRVLARAVAGLILTCDLDLVLLGGGVTGAGAPFLDPLVAELGRLRAASPLVASLIPVGAVRALPADFDPVAWGGVALARRQKEVVARTPLS